MRTKTTLAAVAAAVLAGLTITTAPASAANAPIGAVWTATTPAGERVEFQKVNGVMSKTTSAVTKRSVFNCPSNAVNGTAFCAWTGKSYAGVMYVYNMNNVYANTANGVAHCWNMGTGISDTAESWANFSNRYATVNNWYNCNQGGNFFGMNGVSTHRDCTWFPGNSWCDEGAYHASSIRAGA